MFDVNSDSMLNSDDFDHMIQVILGTEFGDVTLDKNVDANDLALLRINFGGSPLGWAAGNVTLDDIVDANDLAPVRLNFGFSAPSQAVPEPCTVLLLTVVVAGLCRRV